MRCRRDDDGFSAGEWFVIIAFFPFSVLGLLGASGYDGVATLDLGSEASYHSCE